VAPSGLLARLCHAFLVSFSFLSRVFVLMSVLCFLSTSVVNRDVYIMLINNFSLLIINRKVSKSHSVTDEF